MVKKATKKATSTPKKVDYEPNKMTFAISALAAISLVLVAVIATMS